MKIQCDPIVTVLGRFLIVLAAALAAAPPVSAQLDGDALLSEGNELYRSGLYRAALLRYREASARGLDSSLLHYNLGVVYYRLDQYAEAEHWFERAGENRSLAQIAAYNLGLTHRAAGRPDEARLWFRRAAEQGGDRRLRELAERAAASMRPSGGSGARESARARERRRAREAPLGDFRLLTIARFGQDDNVYRSPAEPYVDLSDPAQPTVTPIVQSASFMPVDVLAQYVLQNEAGDTDFIFGYRLDGDFYDSEFSNANRISQRFDIGADIVLHDDENRRRTVDSAFFMRTHDETSFDPDNGIDRDIGGVDVSDRFSYRAAGVEGEFEHTLGNWQWAFDMRFERRQYEETPLVRNYDHHFFFSRAGFEYDINDATSLSFGLRRYRRVYDERLARDLNGDLLAANPSLDYDYRGAQLGISRQVTRSFEIDLDVLQLERIDEFVGYYDYTQNVVRLRGRFRPNRRFDLSIAAVSRSYDYPNAFAFNEPTAGARELDSVGGELSIEYRVTNKLSIWAEMDMTDVTSTDARAQYSRTMAMLGVKWRR